MAIPEVPIIVDSVPLRVKERVIREMDCPNPDCNDSIDITTSKSRTKLKCKGCGNVTWLPEYSQVKWYQKFPSLLGGAFLSVAIGIATQYTWKILDEGETKTDIEKAEAALSDKDYKESQESHIENGSDSKEHPDS